MSSTRELPIAHECSLGGHDKAARTSLTALQVVALITAATFAAAMFGHLTRPVGFLSSFWPANALLMGLMVRNPALATPLGWLGATGGYLMADLLMGGGLAVSLWLTAGNLANAFAGFLLFQRISPADRRLERPQSLLFLLLISTVAAVAAAAVGSGSIVVFFDRSFVHAVELYLASETACNLVVLPMILTAPPLGRLRRSLAGLDRSVRSLLPLAALLVSIVAGTVVGGSGAVSIPVPAILWCALSYGVFPTAVLTFGLGLWQGTVLATSLPPSSAEFMPAIISHRLGLALLSLGPIMVACINGTRGALLKELDRAANQDALTKVLSRRAFLSRSEAALTDCASQGQSVVLLMLDIDQFKRINDEHGHAAGDAALISLTRRIGALLRPQDLFGRMGGEEFAIVLPDIAPAEAGAMAERLREACASLELMLDDGRHVRVTTSIGLVCSPASGATLPDLLRRADDALYAAKRNGRNRVVQAEPIAA